MHKLFRVAFYQSILLSLIGCSVYISRIYNTPEVNACPEFDKPLEPLSPYRMNRFYTKPLHNTFKDTIDNTIVTVRINNNYEKGAWGLPIIPIVPYKDGYGFDEKKLNKIDAVGLATVSIELMINNLKKDSIYFDPSLFYIEGTKNKVKSLYKSMEASPGTQNTHQQLWKIVFAPGVVVEELPIVYLKSFVVNGKNFHPDGIKFKIGRTSFYAPFHSING